MAKEHFQRDMRRGFNAQDQWGRTWLVTIENATGDPCGLTPCFTDPLRTPYIYVKPEANASRLKVDYDRWIQELRQSRKDWERDFHEIGMALYGDAYNADQALKNPKTAHRQRTGYPPLDPVLVELARDGDKELLGLTKMTAKTLEALPRDYQAGVKVA